MSNFTNTSETVPTSPQKSPIEYIAEAFWSDYQESRPIDGGILYEDKLRQCRLNGSMQSLQRLDKLLLELRQSLTQTEMVFIDNTKNRNLLLFIGFYMGKILAQAWGVAPKWLSRSEVNLRYPHLRVDQDNPYHFMALEYLPRRFQTTHESKHLFFVLEPIAQCLFGNPQKPNRSIMGDAVSNSIFQAVFKRLPPAKKEAILEKMQAQQASLVQHTHSRITNKADVADKGHSNNHILATPSHKTVESTVEHSHAEHAKSQDGVFSTSKQSTQQISEQKSTSIEQGVSQKVATVETKADVQTKRQAPVVVKKAQPLIRQDDFTDLRNDLAQISVDQVAGKAEYVKANQILNQFDKHIAKLCQSGKELKQINFDEKHQQARKQAVVQLAKAAKQGNTSAMLRLSICYFLGEGIQKDEHKGFKLVQKAAEMDDPRAQRQLSRLYYQGLGHTQDMMLGRHWLEKAADNGHVEAKALLEQWNQAQTALDERKYDETTDRRYLLLIVGVIILAVMIFILV
ncbi:tetratricopeptide repeat protein [Psychrobacter sp. I-STPA6b]|uniref:tetratricopeptide repeat protein n=1 Tax=Psychrobacter sp. I-STPA6b TaxID=2585718 RepID=UPI001D0CAAA9|nr:tetratricopeptide repeat protein [Psychrobacter sp. I-STPA6b]